MSGSYSIVYVEDDPGSQKVMRGLVETLGFSIDLHIFEDSSHFIPRVEALDPEPDLFLLDIHVSPLNGFDMLQALRRHDDFQGKMIVALTASVMNEEVKQLKEAGFDGILAKPLKFQDFPRHIQRILDGENLWAIKR